MSEIQKYLELHEKTVQYWRDNYDNAHNDLEFLSDTPGAQWDSELYQQRVESGRPAVTIDQLDQFINQVANEVKANTPTINVYPGDEKGSQLMGDIFKGVVRAIEYNSGADDVYDTALVNSIRCSIGWLRVDHDYVEGTNLQELLLRRVTNPLSVFLDPESVDIDGSDAQFAFVEDELDQKSFKKRFPKANPISFGETRECSKDENVKVVEFFEIVEESEEIEENGQLVGRSVKKVKRLIMNGEAVIDEGYFPGKYIPLVPVYGNELWVKNKRVLMSLIRKAKEPQQMFNLWKSLETEILQKQPQAPIMVAEGQIEDYADDWSNPSKSMALRYRQTDSQDKPAPAPQRLLPPQVPAGIVNASMGARDDIKGTMGLYNASIGMVSNETSGIAISERKAQGQMATYQFGDNLFKSIAQVGRVLVYAIPDIYSEARVLRIIGKEDEPKIIGVNGQVVEGQPQTINLSKGVYEVRVTTGAPFSSLRQEAAQTLMQLLTANPQLMQVFGDLLFKNMDFPAAQDIAERIKKTMPPHILNEGVTPEQAQIQQQMQQAQAVVTQLQEQMKVMAQKLENKQAENQIKVGEAQLKAQSEAEKMEIEKAKLQLEVVERQREYEIKQQELAIKKEELEIKRQEALQSNLSERLERMEAIFNKINNAELTAMEDI